MLKLTRPEAHKLLALLTATIVLVLIVTVGSALAPSEDQVQSETNAVIGITTEVRIITFYAACRHSKMQIITGNSAFSGMDAEMLAIYGYTLVWQDGIAVLNTESLDYCPTDRQKSHLRLVQDRLAAFSGPLSSQGELLYYLDIPLQALPARWLAQLTNGGIEFANEETLLMALDNIDELIEYIEVERYI